LEWLALLAVAIVGAAAIWAWQQPDALPWQSGGAIPPQN
jgi:hypothetical protein